MAVFAGSEFWRGRIWLGVILAMCISYYLLCRRLSLAFEWVYLAGFPAAVPLILLARCQLRCHWFPHLDEWLLLSLAYSAYYWASAGLLIWRYSLH